MGPDPKPQSRRTLLLKESTAARHACLTLCRGREVASVRGVIWAGISWPIGRNQGWIPLYHGDAQGPQLNPSSGHPVFHSFVYPSVSPFVGLSNKHPLCANFASGSVEIVKDREAWSAAVHGITVRHDLVTEQLCRLWDATGTEPDRGLCPRAAWGQGQKPAVQW